MEGASAMASNEGESQSEMQGASAKPNCPNPGLLTFKKLAVNKGQITRVEEKMMQSAIDNQDNIIDGTMYCEQFRNAARNVKGLMLFHSYKKNEAIEIWEETLASYPLATNLNALKDIAVAYPKLRFNKKAEEYEEKLSEVIRDANPDEKSLMFARCQFEQGYALSQDLHTKSWRGIDLLQEQVRCYEAALKMAEGLIDKKEKRDWLLYTGKAYEKLCHASFRDVRQDEYMDYIGKTIEKLHEALQMPEENAEYQAEYQAEIWLIIGNTFTRNVKASTCALPPIVEESYKEDWEDPLRCYKKALEFNPINSVWLLGRIGVYYFKQGNFHDALEELNKAIDIADELKQTQHYQSKSVWNALCHRAKICIKEAKRGDAPADIQSSLLDAQKDANKALELNYAPMTLAVSGEVHHLLAKNPLTPPGEVDALRNKALVRFYEASITQDGSTITDVHLKWAQCLQEAKDLPSAIESYKIAIDTTTSLPGQGRYRAYLGLRLICAMLENYRAHDKQKQLLHEVSFWFVYIHSPSKATQMKLKEPVEEYLPEIIDMLEYIVQHIGGLSSKAQDLSKRAIKTTIDFIIHTKKGEFKRRLESIQRENTRNIETAPNLSQELIAEPNLSDNSAPKNPRTKGVDYDFHIIHDETNPDINGWVRYSLLTGLECNFYCLKGFYQQRDATLGALVNATRAQTIEKSAKILIVLSHDFDGKNDLITEMAQCLHDKTTENVIILQRESVEVPPNLRCYMKFDFTVQVNLLDLARYLLPVHSM